MDPQRDLVACTQCATGKRRCDRKVPCSQCIVKNVKCRPRWHARRLRPYPAPAAPAGLATAVTTARTPSPQDEARGSSGGASTALDPSTFSGTTAALWPDVAPATTLDFFGFGAAAAFPSLDDLGSGDGLWLMPDLGSGLSLSAGFQQFEAATPLSMPVPSPARSVAPLPGFGLEQGASNDALEGLELLFEHPAVWQDFDWRDGQRPEDAGLISPAEGPGNAPATAPLSPSNSNCGDGPDQLDLVYRDRLVAAVQTWLSRAAIGTGGRGLFGPLVVLPPSKIMQQFVEVYAARVEPYLAVASSRRIRITKILRVHGAAGVASLLVTILVAQGAMLTDHAHAAALADGLFEVCRPAVADLIARRSIADPMVGGNALQLLILGAWSGRESTTALALSQRAQVLSMLGPAGALSRPMSDPITASMDAQQAWAAWKSQEQRNRLAYAWLNVDLELSLLHDLPPILSSSDLDAPLPDDTKLWHMNDPDAWLAAYQSLRGGAEATAYESLNTLFRAFVQSRLYSSTMATAQDLAQGVGAADRVPPIPVHRLRFLLHPLHAMVLSQQQLMRAFGSGGRAEGIPGPPLHHRVLSRLKVTGRLQETQDLLEQVAALLAHARRRFDQLDLSSRLVDGVTGILLHLISLNTVTSIPDIERVAREHPPATRAQRVAAWAETRYAQTVHPVLFHAGQVFRLLQALPRTGRPPWWPLAAYRAAIACWGLGMPGPSSSPDDGALVVSINTLEPDARETDPYFYGQARTPVLTLGDGRRLPALQGNNSLEFCLSLLEQHSGRLGKNTQAKVEGLMVLGQRWAAAEAMHRTTF